MASSSRVCHRSAGATAEENESLTDFLKVAGRNQDHKTFFHNESNYELGHPPPPDHLFSDLFVLLFPLFSGPLPLPKAIGDGGGTATADYGT
jgi:hypothetical protein